MVRVISVFFGLTHIKIIKTIISFFLNVSFPPNAEGSAEPCEAIGASLSTQARIVFERLLTLAPSVNLTVDTLAKAKRLTHFYSVAPLLEKWFACFPTSGDGLHFLCFSFWAKSYLLLLENEFTRAVILERWTESE